MSPPPPTTTRNLADHMAQWEVHMLRNITAWMVTLADQAHERGLDTAQLAFLFESRRLTFARQQREELARARDLFATYPTA